MTRVRSILAPILRNETQARLLAALLLRPDREASIAELARETGADAGNLHKEAMRLIEADILTDRRVGRARLLRRGDSPLAKPLVDLLELGYGPKPATEHALGAIPGIEAAYIGGSWAARYLGGNGPFPRDVDVIVIGVPNRDDVSEAVRAALRPLGRDSQVIFRSRTAWENADDAFTRTAKASPLVELDLRDEAS
ncbi:ArsR family transcriptional regulator [Nocardia sp. NPDC058658]|uniref:ArsR family transcriptional regulator n=1 Tax=Nocardia sp. NPDC058658 TaxID=3346580 RepID=UPI003652AA95